MITIIHFTGKVWPALLCCAFVLSACAKVGPDFLRPPTVVLSKWLETDSDRLKGTSDYREWWKGFGDPALDRIIERAYNQNLSLRAAGVRVLEARAQLGIAVGELFPQSQQATGSVTFNRASEKSPTVAASLAGGSQQLSYWQDQIALGATWEIDLWGKFRRAVEAADASLLSAIADYDSVLVSLTADAASSYVQIRTLEKRLGIAQQNAETQRESLRIAETRYNGGVTSERDVEQARTVLFNTLSTVPTLEAQLRQTKNALSVLLGLPPDNLADFLEGAADIPPPPPHVAVGIPADLLRRRPDVKSAELQAAAQSARIGVAKAELYPAFSLTGSFGFLASDVGAAKLGDIASFGARTVAAGPAFQWNILNYGRITNNVRVQDARFQALLIAYQNAVLQAQREVEDSLAGFLRSQESAEYLAQSAAAARRSLDLAFVQYSQGSTDFTTVLTAQQALLTAQDSFATAVGNISGNLVGVYRALGGGWEIREGRELVSPDVKAVMAARTNWGNLLSPASYMPREAGERAALRRPDW
ncbi:MAG: efflux transporter outer membrane subunit [Syntrophobacter sp.]